MAQECEGIPTRLTAQNQLFLDTTKPTRNPITPALMEKLIPGFEGGRPTYLQIDHMDMNLHSYHLYNGGNTWVPTVPSSIAAPGERLCIGLRLLTPDRFLSSFPSLNLRSRRKLPWTIERAEVRISPEGENVSLLVRQIPEIEGISEYTVSGRLVPGLRFQTGSVFASIQIFDVFSRPTTVQLHHNGHREAWLSRQTQASARVRFLSFDGVRLRILYHLSKGNSGTVVYLKRPSVLYRLGETKEFPQSIEAAGLEKVFLIDGTQPLRSLERGIIKHGRFYETGRVGAEISYRIVNGLIQVQKLILNEPARGGADLFTDDHHVLVESRFIIDTPISMLPEQIGLELARMTRRLRNDFRWNPSAEVGYAVLSYLDHGRICSLVGRLSAPR